MLSGSTKIPKPNFSIISLQSESSHKAKIGVYEEIYLNSLPDINNVFHVNFI